MCRSSSKFFLLSISVSRGSGRLAIAEWILCLSPCVRHWFSYIIDLDLTTDLRLIPIFDTNVFGDVQRGSIKHADWNRLLSLRPRHGWPLSQVTALELLVGVHVVKPEDFVNVKQRIALAYDLSKGRVLNDPRLLICQEVLRIPFPPEEIPPASSVISKYLDVVRRATFKEQLLKQGVPYKGKRARIDSTSILAELMAGPKEQWRLAIERMADEHYPTWREHFAEKGRRLPLEMRRDLEPISAWHHHRGSFIKALLEWLHAPTSPEVISMLTERLDAVLHFTIFISREFLLRNYSPDKHHSDVFDQFQLQYLAMDRFVCFGSA